jgi:hypothetical protein
VILIVASLLAGCGPAEVPVLREPDAFSDDDRDGYTPEDGDCDDDAPGIHPDAEEICDGVDNDCDELIDGGTVCRVEDVFVQRVVLDVLFVVDSSLSMAAEQSRLRLAAPFFVPYAFEEAGVQHDTHIGVITTDMDDPSHGGRMVSVDGVRFANAEMTTEQAIDWLSVAVEVGTAGSANERARDAIEAALFTHGEGENAGFFREDSHLVVFLVSDEDDASIDVSTLGLVDAMSDLTGDLGFRVNGIVGPEAGCPSDAYGVAHHELVELTLGTTLPICNSTYDGYLQGASQEAVIAALRDRFQLTEDPDGPLTVEVLFPDGTPAPESPLDPSAYDYSPQSRALILAAPIAAGHQLRVTYRKEP